MLMITKKNFHIVYDPKGHYDLHCSSDTFKGAKELFMKKYGKGLTWEEILESGCDHGQLEIIFKPKGTYEK